MNITEEQKELIENFGITTRQSLYSILKNLIKVGILEERDRIICLTQNGENILDSLALFHSSLKGEAFSNINAEIKGPYYKLSEVNLSTNGYKPATYYWLWDLKNGGDIPIKKMTYSAQSGGTPLEKFDIQHSNNISKYDITTDMGDTKLFDIFFRHPLPTNKSTRFWYSYEWPGNYDPDWKPWTFTYRCRDFPVLNLSVCVINPKEIKIMRDSITHNEEVMKNKSSMGPFESQGPEIISTPGLNFLVFHANNIPVGSTIQLKWNFKYI